MHFLTAKNWSQRYDIDSGQKKSLVARGKRGKEEGKGRTADMSNTTTHPTIKHSDKTAVNSCSHARFRTQIVGNRASDEVVAMKRPPNTRSYNIHLCVYSKRLFVHHYDSQPPALFSRLQRIRLV